MVTTVNDYDVLDVHVGLDLECMDGIYVNGYVPNLQVGGQVASFMTAHPGYPILSPAILEKIGTGFRQEVDRFAADNHIPVVRFGKDDRKIDRMRPYLARQAATGRAGVAAIGVAQEFAPVLLATKRTGDTTGVWFSFARAQRRVVYGGWCILMSCRPAPVRSTPPCSVLNVSARAASWRVQPLSGSPSPPSPRMAGGPRPYGSAPLGSRPWPAPCAPPRSPSPASPPRACAP